MTFQPLVTIVTPSYNQEKYILDTIESVLAQGYGNIEHILIDRGSSDGTFSILQNYSHLTIISEPGCEQADAITKGLQIASGAILGILFPGDILLAGALQLVTQEIDPLQDRYILTGGCRFDDEDGNYTGIQHPVYYKNHKQLLEIWKGYGLPYPSTFWVREVWESCNSGDIDQNNPVYDLFCRFSRKYPFNITETTLAAHRLHDGSNVKRLLENEHLEALITASRKHWGSPLSPVYWQLTLSQGWYYLNRIQRGRDLLYNARDYKRQRMYLKSLSSGFAAVLLAPDVAFILCVYSLLRSLREKISNIIRNWIRY